MLAIATVTGSPQAFLAVWEKFKEQITLDDLDLRIENKPAKGKGSVSFAGDTDVFEFLCKKDKLPFAHQQCSRTEVAKNLENNHPLLFSTQYSSSLAQPVALSIESDPRSKRKDEAPAQPNNGQRKKLRQASEGLNL